MTMKTSLDWQSKRAELAQKIHVLGPRGHDLSRMLDNIDPLIAQLGRIEIQIRSRRTGFRLHEEQLDLINQRAQELEHLITFASLL